MTWYHFKSADDAELDALASKLHLHPLHMEDARSAGERVKVEGSSTYVFALLKTLTLVQGAEDPVLETICIFASHAEEAGEKPGQADPFFIVIADTDKVQVAAALRRAQEECSSAPPPRLLYLIFDSIVDSYFPAIDALDDEIDALEDRVISPAPDLLSEIFAVKRQLVDIRRLLVSTRDASMHLQRDGGLPLDSPHQLYLRDLYDHISRLLDTVETQRDLLNNALDIYLSSIANRTNEVVKVLTVLSTIALPALVVTGVYGMNIKGLPFVDSKYAVEWVATLTLSLTGGLLVLMRWLG
ncbi:magnesium transporter CorA family protein [Acidipila sp. EB88]|uniref:magnesium transporter CorA family protein n=1 Tax=Acidipila sp. EB88 TaxID=2305226 RepID=UPI001F35540E|nr:magnesium transporter CorA family protein [Acidipila sp. EB88]